LPHFLRNAAHSFGLDHSNGVAAGRPSFFTPRGLALPFCQSLVIFLDELLVVRGSAAVVGIKVFVSLQHTGEIPAETKLQHVQQVDRLPETRDARGVVIDVSVK
jgi:hypothetical protein